MSDESFNHFHQSQFSNSESEERIQQANIEHQNDQRLINPHSENAFDHGEENNQNIRNGDENNNQEEAVHNDDAIEEFQNNAYEVNENYFPLEVNQLEHQAVLENYDFIQNIQNADFQNIFNEPQDEGILNAPQIIEEEEEERYVLLNHLYHHNEELDQHEPLQRNDSYIKRIKKYFQQFILSLYNSTFTAVTGEERRNHLFQPLIGSFINDSSSFNSLNRNLFSNQTNLCGFLIYERLRQNYHGEDQNINSANSRRLRDILLQSDQRLYNLLFESNLVEAFNEFFQCENLRNCAYLRNILGINYWRDYGHILEQVKNLNFLIDHDATANRHHRRNFQEYKTNLKNYARDNFINHFNSQHQRRRRRIVYHYSDDEESTDSESRLE